MLNVFKPITVKAFKTAYVYNPITKEQKPFKFEYMTDKEVTELQLLRGLDRNTTTIEIKTTDPIYLDTKSQIILDGFYWTIESMPPPKLLPNKNGMYRNITEKLTYLQLKSGAVYDKRLYHKTN